MTTFPSTSCLALIAPLLVAGCADRSPAAANTKDSIDPVSPVLPSEAVFEACAAIRYCNVVTEGLVNIHYDKEPSVREVLYGPFDIPDQKPSPHGFVRVQRADLYDPEAAWFLPDDNPDVPPVYEPGQYIVESAMFYGSRDVIHAVPFDESQATSGGVCQAISEEYNPSPCPTPLNAPDFFDPETMFLLTVVEDLDDFERFDTYEYIPPIDTGPFSETALDFLGRQDQAPDTGVW